MKQTLPDCACGQPAVKRNSANEPVCKTCEHANHHHNVKPKRPYKHDPELGSEEEWLRAFRGFWRRRGMTEPVENFKDVVYAEMRGQQ